MSARSISGSFARRATSGARRPRIHQARTLQSTDLALSAPRLDHLHVLTDETGILQHARFNVPDRNHGYCTDDNARALIVALLGQHVLPNADSLDRLAHRYLGFLQHAFNPEAGRFRNFMGYDRHWQDAIGSEDAHGRALWALGQTVLDSPSPGMTGAAMALFEQSLPALSSLSSPRSWAFALLGLDAYLRRFPGASDARRTRVELAERLVNLLRNNAVAGLALAGRYDHLCQRRHPARAGRFRRGAGTPRDGRRRHRLAALADGHPDRRERPFRADRQ